MIYESKEKIDYQEDKKNNFKEIFILSIATSIDALAIGITFALVDIDIFLSAIIIGIITFILSYSGVLIGNRFGSKYKSTAEIFGGVILILIGFKILIEHLIA